MRTNILIGGKAGQGPNILAHIVAEIFASQGYYVFYSRDYQSLIRGGHNFNVLTFSDEPVYSNDKIIDVLVCLDENTKNLHFQELKKDGKVLGGDYPNMHFAGAMAKIFGIDFKILESKLRKLKDFGKNMEEAKEGYETERENIQLEKLEEKKFIFMNGSQGISEGAIKSGLDIYYAYPMTPATSVLNELAAKQEEKNILVLELENEIAVVNAAIGSSITGAKSMVGTSGGGFDLMTESLSLTGQAEIPLVVYLAQRPGPGTGVATYTAQGDLNIALSSGHGEFPKLVVAPGEPTEAEELASQAFYFSQKYKIPTIILGDKHLGESFYAMEKIPEIKKSEKSTSLKKYSGNEIDERGVTSSKAEVVKKNFEGRLKKFKGIEKEAENFEGIKIHGNKKSKNIVVGWGSTKGAILDAVKNLDCKFIQVLYLEPFPKKIKEELEMAEKIILVENNSTGQLGELISKKTGIFIEDKILKYDGRAFFCDELREEIRRRLK